VLLLLLQVLQLLCVHLLLELTSLLLLLLVLAS
jgi:hypothetical protein